MRSLNETLEDTAAQLGREPRPIVLNQDFGIIAGGTHTDYNS